MYLLNRTKVLGRRQRISTKVRGKLAGGYFALITVNPPYIPGGRGKSSSNNEQLMARHEININLDNILKISSYLLKKRGRF